MNIKIKQMYMESKGIESFLRKKEMFKRNFKKVKIT